MAEPAPRSWTVDAFFAWQEKQVERYELVGGFPLKMMAGTRNVHDDIVVNVLANGGGPDSTVETYGVREVFSVPPEADIDEVQALMREHQVRRVPVIGPGGLLGMISLADIARSADADALGRTTERICE
ncbi:CBS domain-containing protein [Jatrophihabitans endophyticus]|uniref:CBS domain-containing protein n=1 Tax=Jatrophihabitans endophyticus TaxID=1206085 RepID=UPI001A0FEADC|nr:CBS domain-containing protein [Jatrophihabitans endophyticus]MBE7190653.1 CBS domain-containing protein [Jatrophihabitans endophyticus]